MGYRSSSPDLAYSGRATSPFPRQFASTSSVPVQQSILGTEDNVDDILSQMYVAFPFSAFYHILSLYFEFREINDTDLTTVPRSPYGWPLLNAKDMVQGFARIYQHTQRGISVPVAYHLVFGAIKPYKKVKTTYYKHLQTLRHLPFLDVELAINLDETWEELRESADLARQRREDE